MLCDGRSLAFSVCTCVALHATVLSRSLPGSQSGRAGVSLRWICDSRVTPFTAGPCAARQYAKQKQKLLGKERKEEGGPGTSAALVGLHQSSVQ